MRRLLPALVLLAACAPPDDRTDVERLREYTEAVETHCARLVSDLPDNGDVLAGLEVMRAVRDDIRRVPMPPARAAEINRRFLEPLDRMISLTDQAARLQSAHPSSQPHIEESITLLDRADAEITTLDGFFAEYGMEECRDEQD